ncbi:putative RNA polymerase II subunit B1 CTD phosphatase RPAP2 homolog [Sipha flava]|uniref:RNA polymerase II subunit B1 CTD phosphatase RPAP2 homolog n=1 Tax=Sipha flava TaxID=143950 RepID=A0A8B8FPJ7_9HEMI|nr:putative RNA polymerase II subunit B1 CTD phosphatase RPAP2 homolog [Sipha flava]
MFNNNNNNNMESLKQRNVNLKKKIQKSKSLDILKKKYEKIALNIVIELIDGGLEEDIILDKLRSINVCHYEDIVEERFILKQCGYIFCNQHLTSIPTQQYKIINNKVYDITERKKFCSDICYKSSKYLKSQLLTSPLWLRESEIIPKFKLLKSAPMNVFNPEMKLGNSSYFDNEKKLEENLSGLKI